MNILFTGDRGFIAGYAIKELLDNGHKVIGLDNLSKYGVVSRSFDNNKNYFHYYGDAKDTSFIRNLITKYSIDQVVAAASLIGGISYFHSIPYTLLKENELITIAIFEACIKESIEKINVISSSMVFESTTVFPTPEEHVKSVKVPLSSYGFQKLSTEYFCKSAFEEHKLPFTIIRPFNCVGIGEGKALMEKQIMSGNIKLAMSHVVPDICQKILKGQDPIVIFGDGNQLRCYTYGGDIARGIRLAIESPKSICDDFNISFPTPMTVVELVNLISKKINPNKEVRIEYDRPFRYDVQKRIPDIEKAKRILGFEATTNIESIIDEVIAWVDKEIKNGNL